MLSLRPLLFTLTLVSLEAFAINPPSDCQAPTELDSQVGALVKITNSLPQAGCAEPSKLVGICDAVYLKWEGPKGSDYEYMYEKMIHEAACVTPSDTEEVKSSKVQVMWSRLESPHLKCNQANFDVPRGSVLKYALALNNYDFLSLAIDEWRVNLNSVDPNDGRTLLDYVKKEIDRLTGSPYEARLRGYYNRLRKSGARHRNEL